MELIEVDIKGFKKELYLIYKKMFPEVERKPYWKIKRAYKKRNI